MSRRWLRSAALLLLLLTLTGCWNRRELNDLGMVVALGVDLNEEMALEITLTVAQPGAAGAGQGGGEGGPERAKRKVILQETGLTISEALRKAELISPRNLALQHSLVIVIGERLAENGTDLLLDYLLRSNQVRLTAHMVLLRGADIQDLLDVRPVMEELQAQALQEMGESRAGLQITLKDFFIARSTPHRSPIVPVVSLVPHDTREEGAPPVHPRLTGAALFADDKVVEYLDESEVRGAMWLRETARHAVLTVPCPGYPDKYVSVRVARANRQIRPAWDGRRLSFDVGLEGTAYLTDLQCPIRLTELGEETRVERLLEAAVTERVLQAIQKTQKMGMDPFGFGEQVRTRVPQLWRTVEPRWFELWGETEVRVRTRITLRDLQMTNEPPRMKYYEGR